MSDKTTVVDEVSNPAPASKTPKSLSNGLGLEKLLTGAPKPSSPKKVEKAEDTQEDTSEAKPEPKKPAPKAAPKAKPVAAQKAQEVEAKKEEKQPDTVESLSKQLKDTRDYATKVNKKNLELQQSHSVLKAEMDVLKQKLDGTYMESAQPSPQDQQKAADFAARVKVDRAVMNEQFGEEEMDRLIWDPQGPYMELERKDPLIWARIQAADRPLFEAYQVVQEHQFFEKYGRDPEKIKQAIIEEAREEFIRELKGEINGKTGDDIETLSHVTGVPRNEQPKKPNGGIQLNALFPNFSPTHS